MPSLKVLRDFRPLQDLSFCYLCSKEFEHNERLDRDHVPPKKCFHVNDRTPPLKLKVHRYCHELFNDNDRKTCELIGLNYRKAFKKSELTIERIDGLNLTAVTNLDIEALIWRWILGFHAALYKTPLRLKERTMQTPFQQFDPIKLEFKPILVQHTAFVETIKRNRKFNNLDVIKSNAGKLVYECVWCRFDGNEGWFACFALNLYDWKKLGRNALHVSRGCAGSYTIEDRSKPSTACIDRSSNLLIPNYDQLDPFAP